MIEKLIMSFEDVEEHQIYTEEEALTYIGKNIKTYFEVDITK
jgi:tRNA U34 5-carboxymethylaminomethyl modifying enzyme MnmG/GidA